MLHEALAALAEQAQALERAGEWDPAADTYSRMFRAAADGGDLVAATDALRGSARVRRFQGRYEAAEELADLSLEIAERSGLAEAAARALNMVAAIRYLRGDRESARALYTRALERARDAGDDSLIGWVCQNLGVMSNVEGDLREARVLYLESIGASVRARDSSSAMSAYNNLAMVCSDMEGWMESEVFFQRGIEIAERLPSMPFLARLHANRAEPLIHVGELQQALESLDRGHEIASQLGDRGTLSDVARFRGVIARRTGRLGDADRHLAEALAIASDGKQPLERAEALREIGCLRWEQGAEDEARRVLDEARAAFLAVGARWDAERVDRCLSELLSGGTPWTDGRGGR